VNDDKKIAINYLQGWFLLDFISAIPYGLLFENISNVSTIKLMKLNRIMKVRLEHDRDGTPNQPFAGL
jgi:hypothetical protein